VLDWIGWDRLMFSSDYPHWDYDDPRLALSFKMTDAQRAGVLRDNAKALYRL
jgi:predicted TIM-barrel fold metal-dependent hydrolase